MRGSRGKPHAHKFSHLQVGWKFALFTYRKWSVVGWQSCRLLFWQSTDPAYGISLHHIWPPLYKRTQYMCFFSPLAIMFWKAVCVRIWVCGTRDCCRTYCVTPVLRGSTCRLKAQPDWRETGFLRMDYSEACSNQRGRGTTKTSSAPPRVGTPPRPCFTCSQTCFQEGQTSCMMVSWMRSGKRG